MELWAKILIGVIAYLIVSAVYASWIYSRRLSVKTPARERFFEELERQIDFSVIANLEDVVRIQRSIADATGSQRLQRTDIKRLLEGYLLRVSESEKDAERVHNRFEFFKRLLSEEPFAILPEREQAIAQSLRQDIGDQRQDEALRHLLELVSSMGTRYQALDEQLSRTRAWTMIGAAFGILAVVVAVLMWATAFIR